MADEAVNLLLVEHRERLVRFVRVRLDRRLRGRLDPSDVVQEACAEAARRLPEYERDRQVPFYVWLRYLTGQQLALAYRRHLGTRQRDVKKEVAWNGTDNASADILAEHFAASQTSPSGAVAKAEIRDRMTAALEAMPSDDREVLALRHFEQMSNSEVASVMGLTPSAASHRYAKALVRLKTLMRELFGSIEDLRP
jgi:RNA polymerase sigma-70 factor (ECF subfamily)